MFITAVPGSMTSLGVFNLSKIETLPFAFHRATAAHARELIDQSSLHAIFVTKNDRADFATVTLIDAFVCG